MAIAYNDVYVVQIAIEANPSDVKPLKLFRRQKAILDLLSSSVIHHVLTMAYVWYESNY